MIIVQSRSCRRHYVNIRRDTKDIKSKTSYLVSSQGKLWYLVVIYVNSHKSGHCHYNILTYYRENSYSEVNDNPKENITKGTPMKTINLWIYYFEKLNNQFNLVKSKSVLVIS